jgi:hypothetical protein
MNVVGCHHIVENRKAVTLLSPRTANANSAVDHDFRKRAILFSFITGLNGPQTRSGGLNDLNAFGIFLEP